MAYKVFVSYSHSADDRLAPILQAGLHGFARPWNQLRAMRVFLDSRSLSATPKLWSTIRTALQDSEYFLLLASPGSARSEWVPREVEHWLSLGRADKLLVALTDGEIVWDAERNDFDWESTTALPRVMEGVLREPPLFVDFRWANRSSSSHSIIRGFATRSPTSPRPSRAYPRTPSSARTYASIRRVCASAAWRSPRCRSSALPLESPATSASSSGTKRSVSRTSPRRDSSPRRPRSLETATRVCSRSVPCLYLATSSYEQTRLWSAWDTKTPRQIARFESSRISPGAAPMGRSHVWRPADLVREACSRLAFGIGRAQWRRFRAENEATPGPCDDKR